MSQNIFQTMEMAAKNNIPVMLFTIPADKLQAPDVEATMTFTAKVEAPESFIL